MQVTQVVRHAAQTQQAAAAIQHVRRGRLALPLGQHQRDRRVHVTRTCAHHEALQRREAHAGVHRHASLDRTRARAVPEVQRHDPQVPQVPPQHPRRLTRHERVTRPVKAVAPHALTLVQLVRERVQERVPRERRVEGRVEHRHHGPPRQQLARRADALQRRRIVQRREPGEALQLREHLVRHLRRLPEALPAVHRPVPHRVHVLHPHARQGPRERRAVVRHLRLAHAVHQAPREHLPRGRVDMLELQAAAAAVDDENAHECSFM